MPVIADIADAVVASLNAASFSLPVTANRLLLPSFELPEMENLHVSVVPRSVQTLQASRNKNQFDYAIDVAVQQKLDALDNATLDSLLGLVQEIDDHFRGRRLDSYPAAMWVRTENKPVYSVEHLDQLRQFTSVLTFTFRLMR